MANRLNQPMILRGPIALWLWGARFRLLNRRNRQGNHRFYYELGLLTNEQYKHYF